MIVIPSEAGWAIRHTLEWFAIAWIAVAVIGGLSLIVGRLTSGLTAGAINSLASSYGVLGMQRKGLLEYAIPLKLQALAGREIDDYESTKICEMTEPARFHGLRRECVREAIGRWVDTAIVLAPTVTRRKEIVDGILNVLNGARQSPAPDEKNPPDGA